MNIFQRIADRFAKVTSLPTGTYHLQTTLDEKPCRLHLRLQADGTGILIVNASTVLQLNPTAAEYAFHFVKETKPQEAANEIAKRYRVSKDTALLDYNDFVERVETLISTPDLDPVAFLDFELAAPHSATLTAPLRLDCALTYRLSQATQVEYAPTKRVSRELTTDEWKKIINDAWDFGIPQITFTGGEATLRDDLPKLIAEAEKNGQVCGLLTDGSRVADRQYLDALLQTGLDHILFLLQPDNDESWQALDMVLAEDIFTTVHITLSQQNVSSIDAMMERLHTLGIQSLSLTIAENSLQDVFASLRDKAANMGMTLRYDLPVPYSTYNPVSFETLEDALPVGAGNAWLYVEPDGDVLPTQGKADKVLGNLLTDSWSTIYPPQV